MRLPGALVLRGAPGGRMVDPLTGAGWTQASAGGGATATWAASPNRLVIDVPPSVAGWVDEESVAVVRDRYAWDVAARLRVLAGDGSTQTRAGLLVGAGAAAHVAAFVWGDGTVELGRRVDGGWASAGYLAGPDAGQRTGGDLWLRLRSQGGTVRAFWGVGDGGALPAWTLFRAGVGADYARASCGVWVRLFASTLNSSVASGLSVAWLDVRAVGLGTTAAL